MERKRKRVAGVELRGKEGPLVIRWQDGHESRFALAPLRKDCPCAVCREARSEIGLQESREEGLNLLDGVASTATATALKFDYVGRYGLRITWADGHDTGIYTFEALRRRDELQSSPQDE